ncbi:MAG TPA: acyltransferase, partial [Acidisoma sp.]|uniref:acyltransferase family protein n=1 Tax=Acidisoma sp. TaxID=1872115 RepID=UPI002C3CFBD8
VAIYALATTPVLRGADQPPTLAPQRSSSIDGLRGVLALSVVFYHGYLWQGLLRDGVWQVPASRIFAHLGPGAVAVFFMITGYLFWGKMLRERGRPDWLVLYVGRLFRIGPVYLLAIALMLLSVGFRTHWTLQGGLGHLLHAVAVWLPLGAQAGMPNVNGLSRTFLLTAGVTWSLRYEWFFYLALLGLAVMARGGRARAVGMLAVALALTFAWALLHPDTGSALPPLPIACALFLCGMLAASLPPLPRAAGRDGWLSLAVMALVAASFAAPAAFSPLSVACLGLAFYAIASGCTVFGFLGTRPARRLGDVSYPLYLLHGLVLSTLALLPMPLAKPAFWAVLLGAAILAVLLATAAHVLVERPGSELGRRVARTVTASARGRVLAGRPD